MFKGLGLFDTLILVAATGFFFMGVSQIILVGFVGSYWLFMVTFGFLIWFQRRKSVEKEQKDKEEEILKQQKNTKKRKKK